MFKIKASIIGALVFANMAMALALDPAEDSVVAPRRELKANAQSPTSMPTSMPTSIPTPYPSETPVLPSMVVGCLETPGDVTSNFDMRSPASEVFCDEVVGTCADFLVTIEALPNNKGRLVKSIFACNAKNKANTQVNSQKLFDRVKNDDDAIAAILTAVEGSGIIMTGRGDALSTACSAEGYSCCPSGGCSSNSGSFTITTDSCTAIGSCTDIAPKAMVFNSCTGENSCNNFGQFDPYRPHSTSVIGNKIIGPNACTATSSCQNLGKNIYGAIRVQAGACSGLGSCMDLGRRSNQGKRVLSPVIADIIIGDNACQGQNACKNAHRGDSKNLGSLFIGDSACMSTSSCDGVANSDAAVDDLVIAPGTCISTSSCQNCVDTDMCPGSTASTYTIDNPTTDCSTPNPAACS